MFSSRFPVRSRQDSARRQAVRAAGLIATPAGSVTVVSFTVDSANPVGFKLASCGTCIPTVNPVGVLAACPSGATLIDGSKFNRLQPSSANGSPVPVLRTVYSFGAVTTDGSAHESASTRQSSTVPCTTSARSAAAAYSSSPARHGNPNACRSRRSSSCRVPCRAADRRAHPRMSPGCE